MSTSIYCILDFRVKSKYNLRFELWSSDIEGEICFCSLSTPGSYSLSVRDLDHNTGEGVKHYKIRNMDNGGFYITAKISFNSLKELVQHHSRTWSILGGGEVIETTDFLLSSVSL